MQHEICIICQANPSLSRVSKVFSDPDKATFFVIERILTKQNNTQQWTPACIVHSFQLQRLDAFYTATSTQHSFVPWSTHLFACIYHVIHKQFNLSAACLISTPRSHLHSHTTINPTLHSLHFFLLPTAIDIIDRGRWVIFLIALIIVCVPSFFAACSNIHWKMRARIHSVLTVCAIGNSYGTWKHILIRLA